ncbi:MAG TPA: hypothetical protein VFH56_13320 [Acidimicrobiales bacterium]|nr:hypothetical protein [Acidimicrobiales bacterium]
MTGVDLTDTIIPRSDQLNSDDMLTGPRTVTITDVRQGSNEQPVDIHLAEYPGRPFRPSKTVRRILVAAWGKDGDAYVGRRLTLYRDPDVKFGGQDVGGIRVSHMSHIDKPMKLALTVSKGKKAPFTVKPLADEPTQPAVEPAKATAAATEYRDRALDKTATVETLRALYTEVQHKGLDGAEVIDSTGDTVTLGALIKARGEELKGSTHAPDGAP